MKKYFYTDGINKIGPFSLDALRKENLTRETKIWYYGLERWSALSEIDELSSITQSIPPLLRKQESNGSKEVKNNHEALTEGSIIKTTIGQREKIKFGFIITALVLITLSIIFISYNKHQNYKLYKQVASTAYEADVDFDFYVQKFYRDIEVYGIFPKKPSLQIIKFANFDKMDDATHIHGISFGGNDNDKIEIYINPSTWKKFNKPKRYYLMYHELAHDVLNSDDLEDTPQNMNKLMYPVLTSYESITMDDFIENSHALFEEVAAKQK